MSPPASSSSITTTTSKPKLTPHSITPQIRSFLSGQILGTVPAVTPSQLASQSLSNLTIIITGANTGLGLEAAKQLVSLGCASRLILACRSLEKGEAAKRSLVAMKQGTGAPKTKIEVWQLDMARLESIRAFADRCEKEVERVDSVILNAGVDLKEFRAAKEEDGEYEMTVMVNVVGTMVLAVLLVGVMQGQMVRNTGRGKSDAGTGMNPPRISIVGSAVQFFAKYEPLLEASQSNEGILTWLSDKKRWDGKITGDRYYLSKGMVQMLVRRLAKQITAGEKQGKGMVVVNCTNPGYCRTELFRESATLGSRMALRLIGRDADVGARALVVGGVGEKGGLESHGGYMDEGVVKDCHSWFKTEQGEEVAKMMWDEILSTVEMVKPGGAETLKGSS